MLVVVAGAMEGVVVAMVDSEQPSLTHKNNISAESQEPYWSIAVVVVVVVVVVVLVMVVVVVVVVGK